MAEPIDVEKEALFLEDTFSCGEAGCREGLIRLLLARHTRWIADYARRRKGILATELDDIADKLERGEGV